MRFKDTIYFLLLIPIVLALLKMWWDLVYKKKVPRVSVPWKKIWNYKNAVQNIPPRFLHNIGYVVAATFFIIALARPQTSFQKIRKNVEGIDIMLVLDISASMRIEDFRDSNRIDTAKLIIKEFIQGRSSDKIGLEIFSGEPVTLVPPTLDYPLLLQSLKSVEIGDLKDGTAIGDALAAAVGRLKESTAKSRVMILVTDGDSNIGQVDPLTGGELAKGFGIKVYTIAIGRNGRVAMPFVTKDIFGRNVKTYQYFDSSINPELLKQISNMTNAKHYRVEDDVKQFREVFNEIDRLERTKIESTEQIKYDEHFMKYLQFGMIVLLITFLYQFTIGRVFP